MKCPRDHTELTPDALKGISIDKCPTCDGIWLDGGELERIVRTYKIQSANEGKKTVGIPENKFTVISPHPLTWTCPKDGTNLERVAYADDRGTAIEHCTNCQGFWFDHNDVNRALSLHVPDSVTERVATMLLRERIRLDRENKEEVARLQEVITSFAQITSPYGIFYFIAKILEYIVRENMGDNGRRIGK